MNETAIRVEGVTKRYGSLEVLRGVEFSVPVGQLAAVIGKSGSGKSTLLGVVTGLERPDSGKVLIQGRELSSLDEREAADLRRESIGVVFQNFSLIPALCALDNVLLPTFFDERTSVDERRARATDLLDQVGLRDRALPSPLGVERRRTTARSHRPRSGERTIDPPGGRTDRQSRYRDWHRRAGATTGQ